MKFLHHNLFLLFLLVFLGTTLNATSQTTIISSTPTQTIKLTLGKIVQLVFPSEIKKCRGGFVPDEDFILEMYENSLYIQPLIEFKETNLSIITTDNNVYVMNLTYTPSITESVYVFNDEAAIKIRSSATVTAVSTSAPTVAPHTTTTPPVEQLGGIIIDTADVVLKRIAQLRGFINVSNGIQTSNMSVFLKGIYTNGNYMYFQIEVNNNSFIKYDYNYIGFSIVVKKKGKTMSNDRVDLTPVSIYLPNKILQKGSSILVYKLDKFTINNEKQLLIEIFEGNGERNISFPISAKMILDAKPI